MSSHEPYSSEAFKLFGFVKTEGEGAQSQSKEAEDDKLLEEYYLKFKGPSDDKKYHLIPKFYSKVCTE